MTTVRAVFTLLFVLWNVSTNNAYTVGNTRSVVFKSITSNVGYSLVRLEAKKKGASGGGGGGGFGGGDGGGGGGSGKKKASSSSSTSSKLKPKTQWDRYGDMKKATDVKVGVKSSDNEDWFEVGYVKSENDEYTEIAVTRQRGLIAEHAIRLNPLKFSSKTKMEWAYINAETDEWTKLDTTTTTSTDEENVERKIGFEGIADPSSGYYCYYDNGKLIDRSERSKGRKSFSKN